MANPGCYPTSVILGLAPLLKNGFNTSNNFIVDSKTGIMGAGRKATLSFHFPECEGSVWAYKIGQHQHTPEMVQELSRISGKKTGVLFTPHVVPASRGILSTIYADIRGGLRLTEIIGAYEDFYRESPFVRIYPEGKLPHTKDISSNNFCDIGFGYDSESGKLIIVSTVDNLLKGAAGQAVQNMNIMFGYDQKEGLI
ncbi:MAG: N-acetyl-gamma-glutamyl-phosphate reductase [bacterium]|nr:N-acetyl-gamma-glutamyl-phosphate reductase [bacterium]